MNVAAFNQEAYFKVMETQMNLLASSTHFRDDTTSQNEVFTSRSPTTTKAEKVVRFTTVTVHEHPIIIGCNPAVSSGVPITIAWNSVSSRQLPIDDFEFDRHKERLANPMFLKQTKSERWNVLQNLGFPSDEMRLAEQEATEIRCLRSLSKISEYADDTASVARLQALLEESRARRDYILKQKPHRSMRLRRFFA
jgi:hypothetical protein